MNTNSHAGPVAEVSNAAPLRFPRRRRCLLALIVLAFAGSLVFMYIWQSRLTASDLFRQYVLDPIPASVNHIKVTGPTYHAGYMYVFRFDTRREDLDLFLASRPLTKVQITNVWSDGEIQWVLTDTNRPPDRYYSFTPFYEGAPSWYNLQSWYNLRSSGSLESFAFMQEVDDSRGLEGVQILVYNARLEQAFFITKYISHTMPQLF